MKSYSFEHVYGNDSGEQVEIHRKSHGFRPGIMILCLLLAFLFWLVVTNLSDDKPLDGATTPDTEQTVEGEDSAS